MEVVTIDVCNLLTYVVPNHCVQALPYVCLDFFFNYIFRLMLEITDVRVGVSIKDAQGLGT